MTELAADETAALLEHRIIAHFELARLRHQRGDRERAFDHWEQGHGLLARTQPFSREARQFVTASIEAFNSWRLAEGPRADDHDPAPVFIVGLPRSGTTLVEQILSAIPQIHAAGERPAIYETLARLGPAPLTADVGAQGRGPRRERLDRNRAGATCGNCMPWRRRRDTSPTRCREMRCISVSSPPSCLAPGSSIACAIRAMSGFRSSSSGFSDTIPMPTDLADLGWYIGRHLRVMDHWQAVLPVPLAVVRLADWVEDFAGTLRRLLAFLDLAYEPACERFYLQDRKVRTASQDQVRRPVNGRGLDRWRDYAHRLRPLIDELKSAGALGQEAPPPPRGRAEP